MRVVCGAHTFDCWGASHSQLGVNRTESAEHRTARPRARRSYSERVYCIEVERLCCGDSVLASPRFKHTHV